MRSARIVGCLSCPYFKVGGMFSENRCAHRNRRLSDIDPRKPRTDGLDSYRISRDCLLTHVDGIAGYMGDEQERLDIYPIDEVLDQVPDDISNKRARVSGHMLEFHGEEVNFATMNLRLFRRKGVKCACCGVEGRYFAAERNHAGKDWVWQLRLYAIDYDGFEVLMTKDHVCPESRGGKTALDNLQPMCVKCNHTKGNNTGA